MFGKKEKAPNKNGLYEVRLEGQTLNNLGIHIYHDGQRAEAQKDERGLSGNYYLSKTIWYESFRLGLGEQVELVDRENARLAAAGSRLVFSPAFNAATVLETNAKILKEYGINLLEYKYSRFGQNGSLIAGYFSPGRSAVVYDVFLPVERSSDVGLFALAVKA